MAPEEPLVAAQETATARGIPANAATGGAVQGGLAGAGGGNSLSGGHQQTEQQQQQVVEAAAAEVPSWERRKELIVDVFLVRKGDGELGWGERRNPPVVKVRHVRRPCQLAVYNVMCLCDLF
jgi:membrane protease subunit (stomatin/prohibitin family)